MSQMVCDRCGRKEDTCAHSHYPDYAVERQEDFIRNLKLVSQVCCTITLALFLATVMSIWYEGNKIERMVQREIGKIVEGGVLR